jgi:hypothetical protein
MFEVDVSGSAPNIFISRADNHNVGGEEVSLDSEELSGLGIRHENDEGEPSD